MLDKLKDAAYIIDFDGEIIDVNEAAFKRLGYSKEELMRMNVNDIEAELDLPKIREYSKIVKDNGEQIFQTTHKTNSGEKFPVEVHSNLIEYENRKAILSIAREITDRKEAQKGFEKLFNKLGDAIFVYRIDSDNYGEILEVNPKAVEQTGYTREELLDMNLVKDLAVGSGKNFEQEYQEKGRVTFEQKKKKKDGTEYWTETVGVPINYKGINAALSIQRNIQKRKQLEKREEFLHSILRHDVKNKNQVVRGYLELIEEYELQDEIEKFLEKAKKANKESQEIIEKVEDLKKINKSNTRPIKLNTVIKEVIQENKLEAQKNNIKIIKNLNKTNIKVKGGPLLKEVFYNLINNSIKHSNGTKIKIKTKNNPNKIEIIIEDNGKGIPDKEKQKVFEKGYKKGSSSGSGLGLALAKTAIQKYNGQIKIKDSELGGAKFEIHLKKPKNNKT